jgi:hypothetical protein
MSLEPREGETSFLFLAALILILFMALLCVHFWRESQYLREHCSFIPDNMMELPNE